MRIPLVLIAVARVAAAQPATEAKRAVAENGERKPWRMDQAISAPGWLELGLEQQSRYEHLSHDYRANATSDAFALSMEDTTDLEHRALTTHAEVGISPRIPWKPRLAMLHDYASGDRNPMDGSTERFDPLFGARRFDFGPIGIYGPVNRSNIQSPGARISIAPTAKVDAFVAYRLFWLASRTDGWGAANVRDSMGGSGTFVGEHVEIQLRWSPFPMNLSLEAGAAYLRRGEFAKSAPDTRVANPAYVYSQVTVNL